MKKFSVSSYKASGDLLSGRVILITGAGNGIGRAVAIAVARYGATAVLTGRNINSLETTYDQVVRETSSEAVICPLDLEHAKDADYLELKNRIEVEFGTLDGLVNNAAILGDRMPLNQYNSELWEKVLQTNVTAQFQLTRSLMPLLEQSTHGGSIIFTTSGAGQSSRAFWGAYAVSKCAVDALMRGWAAEQENLGELRINAINPGATRTAMRAKAYPAENPSDLKTADQIIWAYLYLLGNDSLGVNGKTIHAQQ